LRDADPAVSQLRRRKQAAHCDVLRGHHLTPSLPCAGDQTGPPEIGRHLARDISEAGFLTVGDQKVAGVAQGIEPAKAETAARLQGDQHVAVVGDRVARSTAKHGRRRGLRYYRLAGIAPHMKPAARERSGASFPVLLLERG
jgi:hypothetical protein